MISPYSAAQFILKTFPIVSPPATKIPIPTIPTCPLQRHWFVCPQSPSTLPRLAIRNPHLCRPGPIFHIHLHGLHLRKQCVSLARRRKMLCVIFLRTSLRAPVRVPYTCPSDVSLGVPTSLPTHLPTTAHTEFPTRSSFLPCHA